MPLARMFRRANEKKTRLGQLTTHVLDTAHGVPAAGVTVRLYAENGDLLLETKTNSDGRCDKPLLEGVTFRVGRYQLEFGAAAYFRARGSVLPEPPFLDKVVIAFGISDDDAHYHVPLLLSPFGYSTYRGS